MDCISSEEIRGVPQKVQGPRPSLMQTILPHERQFGAAVKTSCFSPIQEHLRRSGCRVGLVDISRARRADSRSSRSLETPRMEVPPVTWIFCCWGFAFLVFTLTRSEVRVPVGRELRAGEACCANVGCGEGAPFEVVGSCFAAGVGSRGLSGAREPGGFCVWV